LRYEVEERLKRLETDGPSCEKTRWVIRSRRVLTLTVRKNVYKYQKADEVRALGYESDGCRTA
jgi:hypothetical protein